MARLSVVVPVYGAPEMLARCLEALRASQYEAHEILVVDDGSPGESAAEIAAAVQRHPGVRLLRQPNGGPAVARNHGARAAAGDVLVFVDADVVVHPETLGQFAAAFAADDGLAAVFGAYDDRPTARTLVSDYRNLLHHWTHQQARRQAATFWAGCGAVRRAAFWRVDGFDERYGRPSIEDVEFGLRLTAAGARVELRPEIQATHEKRWTPGSFLRTDLFQRAIPWTELLLERGHALPRDLNFGFAQRASAALAMLAAGALLLLPALPWLAAGALLAAAGALLVLNRGFLGFLARTRGAGFAAGAAPWHAAHYLVSGVGFGVGAWRVWRRADPWGAPVALMLALVIVGIQWAGGAFAADFASHPDEAAHYVSGVMVREYLRAPTGDPLAFAEAYHAHYPKVALGHWPPLFALAEGLWFAVFGTSRTAALLFTGSCGWLLALGVYGLARRSAGVWPSVGGALLLVAAAPFQSSLAVMADGFTAGLTLAAAAVFARWMERPSSGAAVAFGGLAALALLAKGTAAPLALVPAAGLLLTGRVALARRGDLWIAAGPVLLLALPWYLWAADRFASPDTSGGFVLAGGSWRPLVEYGPVLGGLALAGLRSRGAGGMATLVAASLAAPLFVKSFQESRHYLAAAAAGAVLAALALERLPRRGRAPAAALAAAGALLLGGPGGPKFGESTYRPWVAAMAGPPARLLVSGGAFEEGAVIAALAERWPAPRTVVTRGSKALASSDWNGRSYRLRFNGVEAVAGELDRREIEAVVPGQPPRRTEAPHDRLLDRATQEWPRSREWPFLRLRPARVHAARP